MSAPLLQEVVPFCISLTRALFILSASLLYAPASLINYGSAAPPVPEGVLFCI